MQYYAEISIGMHSCEKFDCRVRNIVNYFHTKKTHSCWQTYLQNIKARVIEETLYSTSTMAVSMVRFQTGERVKLVFACAWCPKSQRPRIKQDEEYSHGVCQRHFARLMTGLINKRRVRH